MTTDEHREALSIMVDEVLELTVQIAKPLAEEADRPLVAVVGAALLMAFTRAHLVTFSDVATPASILTSVSLGFSEAAKQTAEAARQGGPLQ